MLTVALTGGIASGKSVVTRILEEKGCYIHYADKIAHELMRPEKPAWKKIVDHFGPQILNRDKTINRTKLGAIVFSDEKERLFVNRVIHPLVLEKKKQTIESLQGTKRYKIFVSEAALTIESGYADFFDRVIVVYCREDLQVERLAKRDGISSAEALKKIKSQMPVKKKLKYADYVIDTSGSFQETEERTEKVYKNLLRDYNLKLSREKIKG